MKRTALSILSAAVVAAALFILPAQASSSKSSGLVGEVLYRTSQVSSNLRQFPDGDFIRFEEIRAAGQDRDPPDLRES